MNMEKDPNGSRHDSNDARRNTPSVRGMLSGHSDGVCSTSL